MGFARKRYKFSSVLNKKIEQLYLLDNWHGIVALMSDYGIIVCAVFLALYFNWLYPLSLFIIASRQRALATLQHEAAHFTLAKNRFLNYMLGSVLSGSLIFQDLNLYLKSHVRKHHAFLGDSARDPDYKYHIDLGLYNVTDFLHKTKLDRWLRLGKCIVSYLFYIIKNRMHDMLSYGKACATTLLLNVILIFLLFYCGGIKYYLLFWIIPMLTFYLFIGWFIELAEHYPLIGKYKVDINMSRNRFSHWLESFFFSMHNENYHLTHHLKPRVPFWNLKKAHVILMNDVNYCKVNQSMGGIFISKNNRQTVLKFLLTSIW